MNRPARILLVASPSDATDALRAVHLGGEVEAHTIDTADALQNAFAASDAAWDAVVVVPGSPVEDVEVAAYVPDGVPLVVVAPDVPLLLTETAAQPVVLDDLPSLVGRLGADALAAVAGDGMAADPHDLSLLTHSAASGSPAPAAPPTPMLDSPFGRPAAPLEDDPAPPDAPETDADAPEADEAPVLIVRAQPAVAPEATIPDLPADPPEDATVVEPEADKQPSILVVEDNNDTRMLLERILRATYDVTAVGDARSALQAMNGCRFDGLVLDINLGGKETGADVLRIARSLPGYDGVFAIALTAYALPGDRERLLEAGFDEYISKPFTRQSLMETLSAGILA